jgi:hypothetical protein
MNTPLQNLASDDDTWEPDDHLGTAAEKVASYNESRPNIWQGHEQRHLWAGLGFGDTLQVLDTTDGSGYGEWLDAVVTNMHMGDCAADAGGSRATAALRGAGHTPQQTAPAAR